jgi:hypothetical protein
MVDRVDDAGLGTHPVARKDDARGLFARLALPLGGVLVAAALLAGYVVYNGEGGKADGGKAKPATTAAAATAPTRTTEPAADVASAPVAAIAAIAPTAAVEPPPVAAVEPPPAAAVEPAPAAAPNVAAPVAATAVEPAPVVAAAPAKATSGLVELRFDSNPAGASVTLIQDGRPSYLGDTPVSGSLEAGHAYDLVFAIEGRPSQLVHVDPGTTRHVEVDLTGKAAATMPAATAPASVAKAMPAVTPAVAAPTHVAKPSPAGHPTSKAHLVDATPRAHRAATEVTPTAHHAIAATTPTHAETPRAAKHAAGTGILMIASKPPCQIYVDGHATGLTTPQRSVPLAAGSHKITLVNAAQHVKKTVEVDITADKSTKVIQDLMKK